ncbi:major facilitator superfamily domain-containing protein [Fomitopsis serialis]|uniref:major facilitator superfamily domain-containing protein n=1 Tax=Fomitopsis serialis TaxID=139415 RepID=UPI002008B3DE|nr:major facilitator superfamily domain-containing protein [Neoantrodia serialis]KAH9910482.1 major facilitator superfamily domain-containing protein [Neoantrodia serialis]
MDDQTRTLEPVAKERVVQVKLDIEHAEVKDDPRKWSKSRKYILVAMISAACMINGLGASIYNPAIVQIESDLHATATQFSLTLSLFVIIQGGFPILWSSISEIHGRKVVYLASITLCMVGCIVAATSKTIDVLIGMRCLQAAGSSAVLNIGAATLADLYEPAERGTMMGIYLCAPLLGPSLGPILGGVLTQAFNWRATFWFLAIFTGLCVLSFAFFRDTFRKERSLAYQNVLKRVLEQEAKKTTRDAGKQVVSEKDTSDARITVVPTDNNSSNETEADAKLGEDGVAVKEARLSLKDVNPIGPMIRIFQRRNNVVLFIASAFIFAFNITITYTASRTLASQYHYDALDIGFVLLAYGMGCLFGSVLGGRYSDHVFTKLRAKHEGKSQPEARALTMVPMLFFPPSVIAYGWVMLAYVVDSNVGRSSAAVACNSLFRGTLAFVATEVAVPLQVRISDSIGDGGLYSLWGGLTFLCELLILLVWWKGGRWRERAI